MRQNCSDGHTDYEILTNWATMLLSEVYDRIYYRYADPDYSITEMPLSIEDCKLIKKAIILLENKKDKKNEDTIQVLNKVQDRLKSILNFV